MGVCAWVDTCDVDVGCSDRRHVRGRQHGKVALPRLPVCARIPPCCGGCFEIAIPTAVYNSRVDLDGLRVAVLVDGAAGEDHAGDRESAGVVLVAAVVHEA